MLPNCLPIRTRGLPADIKQPPGPDADGTSSYEQWKHTKDERLRDQAWDHYEKGARFRKRTVAGAAAFVNYADVCMDLGHWQGAIDALEQAVSIYEERQCFDKVFPLLGKQHEAVANAAVDLEEAGESEKAKIFREQLRQLGMEMTKAFRRQRNEPIVESAYSVDQGRAGCSDSTPIGTYNVHACACLLLRDPDTSYTVLAHVDDSTTPASLEAIIDRMPPRTPPERPWQAMIIGSKYRGDHWDISSEKVGASNRNLKNVLEFLDDKDVDLIGATIQNRAQPVAFVVDPKTFKIKEAAPGVVHLEDVFDYAKFILDSESEPLDITFDLMESSRHAPMLLSESDVEKLREVGQYDEVQLYGWLKESSSFPPEEVPLLVASLLALNENYEKSVQHVIAMLEAKISALRSDHVEIDDEEFQVVKEAIEAHAMHVGEAANLANQPLVDFIQQDLVILEERNGQQIAKLNVDGLKDIAFNKQPFTVIEDTLAEIYQTVESMLGTDHFEMVPVNQKPQFSGKVYCVIGDIACVEVSKGQGTIKPQAKAAEVLDASAPGNKALPYKKTFVIGTAKELGLDSITQDQQVTCNLWKSAQRNFSLDR